MQDGVRALVTAFAPPNRASLLSELAKALSHHSLQSLTLQDKKHACRLGSGPLWQPLHHQTGQPQCQAWLWRCHSWVPVQEGHCTC